VVFNLFNAATHFATQFNQTIPFRKLPVKHMKCSCVCTIENENGEKILYDITVLNKDSFIKLMYMAVSLRIKVKHRQTLSSPTFSSLVTSKAQFHKSKKTVHKRLFRLTIAQAE